MNNRESNAAAPECTCWTRSGITSLHGLHDTECPLSRLAPRQADAPGLSAAEECHLVKAVVHGNCKGEIRHREATCDAFLCLPELRPEHYELLNITLTRDALSTIISATAPVRVDLAATPADETRADQLHRWLYDSDLLFLHRVAAKEPCMRAAGECPATEPDHSYWCASCIARGIDVTEILDKQWKEQTAPSRDEQETARRIVEAEFGTPADSPIYQTAGRIIERVIERFAAALAESRSVAVAGLEADLKAALEDGRNGPFRHWHPWVVQDMLSVIMSVITARITTPSEEK